jgi:hypothetical protein
MHVACNPKSTLEDAHALAMRVEDAVCHEVPAARLEIHMDPGTAKHKHAVVGTPMDQDDETTTTIPMTTSGLPSRLGPEDVDVDAGDTGSSPAEPGSGTSMIERRDA